jgi:hypothetical protein
MDKSLDIPMSLKMNRKCFADIEKLDRGEEADESQILELLQFIDTRYDCADFRMVCILRTMYAYAGLVSGTTLGVMKKTVLAFKYWMDEPGEDSMCYWLKTISCCSPHASIWLGSCIPKKYFQTAASQGKRTAIRRNTCCSPGL